MAGIDLNPDVPFMRESLFYFPNQVKYLIQLFCLLSVKHKMLFIFVSSYFGAFFGICIKCIAFVQNFAYFSWAAILWHYIMSVFNFWWFSPKCWCMPPTLSEFTLLYMTEWHFALWPWMQYWFFRWNKTDVPNLNFLGTVD